MQKARSACGLPKRKKKVKKQQASQLYSEEGYNINAGHMLQNVDRPLREESELIEYGTEESTHPIELKVEYEDDDIDKQKMTITGDIPEFAKLAKFQSNTYSIFLTDTILNYISSNRQ